MIRRLLSIDVKRMLLGLPPGYFLADYARRVVIPAAPRARKESIYNSEYLW